MRIAAFLLLITGLTSSCSTELEVNAPYEEIPVVYGLLNASDTVHYIKINKSFLGQADANQMAMIPDSFVYDDVLNVSIREEGVPGLDREFQLERIPVTKDELNEFGLPGAFATEDQFIYRFITGATPLSSDAIYRLKVENTQSGLVTSARTEMVNSGLNVTRPRPGDADLISFASIRNPENYRIEYKSVEGGRRYAVSMTMTYIEVNKSSGDSVYKTIAWDLGERKAPSLDGGYPLDRMITYQEFYGPIEQNIPELDGTVDRLLYKMDFTFWIAGEEMNTYMEVNRPSTGIIQEKPVYSNVENGIGIFSSRYDYHVNNKYFSKFTADQLSSKPNAHPSYGRRFTHFYGQVAPGSTVFQFISLQ